MYRYIPYVTQYRVHVICKSHTQWIIERRKGIGNARAAPHVMYAMCKCQHNPCWLRAANNHTRKFTLVANTEVSYMEVHF